MPGILTVPGLGAGRPVLGLGCGRDPPQVEQPAYIGSIGLIICNIL